MRKAALTFLCNNGQSFDRKQRQGASIPGNNARGVDIQRLERKRLLTTIQFLTLFFILQIRTQRNN